MNKDRPVRVYRLDITCPRDAFGLSRTEAVA